MKINDITKKVKCGVMAGLVAIASPGLPVIMTDFIVKELPKKQVGINFDAYSTLNVLSHEEIMLDIHEHLTASATAAQEGYGKAAEKLVHVL